MFWMVQLRVAAATTRELWLSRTDPNTCFKGNIEGSPSTLFLSGVRPDSSTDRWKSSRVVKTFWRDIRWFLVNKINQGTNPVTEADSLGYVFT